MLAELYKANPKLKDRVKKGAGYATLKRSDINLFLLASGNGNGLLVDRRTGKETFTHVVSLGGELRRINAAWAIEGLDRPTETVTLLGPMGGSKPACGSPIQTNLPHLQIGDALLVNYTEALAITLEELPKAPAQTH